jgi:hypothetical protein
MTGEKPDNGGYFGKLTQGIGSLCLGETGY